MYYLGIDPGKLGGWALLNSKGVVIDAGVNNLDAMSQAFRYAVMDASIIGLERAQPAQDQGHQFEYGRGFGRLEGFIMALEKWALVTHLAPAWWKAKIGCPTDKKLAVAFARKLMPELYEYENSRANVPDGIAEAALMARVMMDPELVGKAADNKAKRERIKRRKKVQYKD